MHLNRFEWKPLTVLGVHLSYYAIESGRVRVATHSYPASDLEKAVLWIVLRVGQYEYGEITVDTLSSIASDCEKYGYVPLLKHYLTNVMLDNSLTYATAIEDDPISYVNYCTLNIDTFSSAVREYARSLV